MIAGYAALGSTTEALGRIVAFMVERRVPTREAETPRWRCTYPECEYEVPSLTQPDNHRAHPDYEMERVWS